MGIKLKSMGNLSTQVFFNITMAIKILYSFVADLYTVSNTSFEKWKKGQGSLKWEVLPTKVMPGFRLGRTNIQFGPR